MKLILAAAFALATSACAPPVLVCQNQEVDSIAAGQVQVRKVFADPDRTKFNMGAGKMESEDPCVWLAAGSGVGVNKFGGPVPFIWQVRVRYDGPEWADQHVYDIVVKERT